MVNIDEIMDMLDWNRPPEIQKRGREMARSIRCIHVFLQPGHQEHNKNVWENCAKILTERTDQELKPYLYNLLKWLTDMNWPGAIEIYNRLKKYKKDDLFMLVLDECVTEAQAFHEINWLRTLKEFQ